MAGKTNGPPLGFIQRRDREYEAMSSQLQELPEYITISHPKQPPAWLPMKENGPPRERQAGDIYEEFGDFFNTGHFSYIRNQKQHHIVAIARRHGLTLPKAAVVCELAGIGPEGGAA